MASILIVCTANICRSPVVEALLKARLEGRDLTDWQVSSAGTWANEGNLPSEFSELLMSEQGFDISGHRSRCVTKELMSSSDLVLTMEAGHAEALRIEFGADAFKVHMLTEMAGADHNVEDPYGGPRAGYEKMVAEVEELIDKGLDQIIDLASANEAMRYSAE